MRQLSPTPRRVALVAALVVAVVTAVAPSGTWARPEAARTTEHTESAQAAGTCTNARRLQRWRLTGLAWHTVVVPVEETHVGAASAEVAAGAGGVILFGSSAPADLGSRLHRLLSLAPHRLQPVVMTDEEGGTVQRMPDLVGSVPSARYMGAHWTPRHIRSEADGLAVRMRQLGVTMDLAPVLDLDGRPGPDADDAIGTRSFSPHRSITTPDGLAFADGLRAGGVTPVVKHFPGIGGADGNTDLTSASTPPWSEVRRNDLRPFQSAVHAGLPAVMVSNARVPGLTRLPATLSRAAVQRVLRGQLGFGGLVLPDSLTAGAVTAAGFSLDSAAVRVLAVGEDMVLFDVAADQLQATTTGIVHAVVAAVRRGALPRSRLEAAVGHVLQAENVDLCTR